MPKIDDYSQNVTVPKIKSLTSNSTCLKMKMSEVITGNGMLVHDRQLQQRYHLPRRLRCEGSILVIFKNVYLCKNINSRIATEMSPPVVMEICVIFLIHLQASEPENGADGKVSLPNNIIIIFPLFALLLPF